MRRIYRETDESLVAGVCSGLGRYLDVDPVLVRLVWAVVTLFTGGVPGALSYAAAWILVPKRPAPVAQASPQRA